MSSPKDVYDKAIDFALGVVFNAWRRFGELIGVEWYVQINPSVLELLQKAVEKIQEATDERDEMMEERDALLDQVELLQRASTAEHSGADRPNRHKLTTREVSMIRDLKRSGATNREIADAYDINPATVSRIVRGIYYRAA